MIKTRNVAIMFKSYKILFIQNSSEQLCLPSDKQVYHYILSMYLYYIDFLLPLGKADDIYRA